MTRTSHKSPSNDQLDEAPKTGWHGHYAFEKMVAEEGLEPPTNGL